jgi:hypothetical protein
MNTAMQSQVSKLGRTTLGDRYDMMDLQMSPRRAPAAGADERAAVTITLANFTLHPARDVP